MAVSLFTLLRGTPPRSDQLPDFWKRIKSQKGLFNPGAPTNADNYMNFLRGLKNIERVVSLKQQLKGAFVLV